MIHLFVGYQALMIIDTVHDVKFVKHLSGSVLVFYAGISIRYFSKLLSVF